MPGNVNLPAWSSDGPSALIKDITNNRAHHTPQEAVNVPPTAGVNSQGRATAAYANGAGALAQRSEDATAAFEVSQHKLEELATIFTRAGIGCRISDNVEGELWAKMIINCAYNAISALGRSRHRGARADA
jgi:ketopantoate reductase